MHLAAAASSLVALAAAFPSAAQDMAQESPWSGFYVGGTLGANWSDSSIDHSVASGGGPVVIPPADIALINATGGSGSNRTGFTGGVEAGYNYQMGSWLLGLETEFVALETNQRITNTYQSALPIATPASYSLNERAKTSWMWSLRPRLGYISGPWLFYGTGGIATSDIKVKLDLSDNRSPPNAIVNDKSKSKTGWIAGLGAGYAFSPNWSLKGEWLYADFGSISTTVADPSGFVSLTSKAKVQSNIARIGVDYRF
jgi:outer membrane immunogenic protein